MAERKSLKRMILQQAVSENVDTLAGRRSDMASRLQRFLPKARRPTLVISLLLVMFAALALAMLYRDEIERMDSMPAQDGAALMPIRPGAPRLSPAEILASRMSFPTPIPVDRSVFPLKVERIVIDAGHGGDNLGTAAAGGMVEKTLTLDISERLRLLLEAAGFDVLMTREEDVPLSLEERAQLANSHRGDLFVSVHLNWLQNQKDWGIETFYVGPTEDPYLTELAAQENVESGYSLADLRRLLQSLYTNVRQDESRRLAEAVQGGLLSTLRTVNSKVKDRGVKKAPFVVLIGTEMPAILAEVSCLSDPSEVERLRSMEYRQLIAQSLSEGIQVYSEDIYRSKRISQKGS